MAPCFAMEDQAQNVIFAFAITKIITEHLFSLNLEDWHSLIFANKTTSGIVLTNLKYKFDPENQLVYSAVKSYGTHAIYHIHTPRAMECALLLGGYSITNDSCRRCEIRREWTPFICALWYGTVAHTKNIAKIGLTKHDTADAWNLLYPALQNCDIDKFKIIEPIIESHGIMHCEIISAIFSMSNTALVEKCLKFAISELDININSVDEEGNNALYGGVMYDSDVIPIMKKYGLIIDYRNIHGENIIDQLSQVLDNNMQEIVDNDLLYDYLFEVDALISFPEFSEDEDAANLLARIERNLELHFFPPPQLTIQT